MKIIHTAHVRHQPDTVAAAAADWLRQESGGQEPETLQHEDGSQTVYYQDVVDWVLISSEFHIAQGGTGTDIRFLLEMSGTTFLSRMRNLSMNIARRVVKQQSAHAFQAFIETLPPL